MEEGLVHQDVKLQAGSSLALVSLIPQMVVEQQEVRGPAGLKEDSPQADNSLSAQSESCKGSSLLGLFLTQAVAATPWLPCCLVPHLVVFLQILSVLQQLRVFACRVLCVVGWDSDGRNGS